LICRPTKLEEPKIDPEIQNDLDKIQRERDQMEEAE